MAIYAALDSKQFINAAFRLLQAAAPGCFASTIQRHIDSRGALWVSSNGLRLKAGNLEDFYRAHPGHRFLVEHPGTKLLPTRGIFPEGEELLTSHFYRHYMVPMRWRHALSLCFWEEPSLDGLDCIFSMHRTEAQGDFSAAETRLLKSLHPLIDNARRRVDKLQIERSKLHSLEELIRDLPLAAAVLDWNLRPVYHNLAGRNECALWRQGENARAIKHDGNNFNVPDDLLQVCREMKREWSDISRLDAHSGRTMKREARNQRSLRALISLIPLNGSTFGKPSFLLQFVTLSKENAHPEPRTRNLSLLARLTREEREVAGLVCEGKSNDEIASSLSKSVWTVKRQMCSIFRKLDLKNRTELAMRLLTYSAKVSL